MAEDCNSQQIRFNNYLITNTYFTCVSQLIVNRASYTKVEFMFCNNARNEE